MRLLEVPITWLRDALASWSGPGQPHAPARPASLTPAHHQVPDGLVQPDQTTCGSACLVVARALGDPDYAAWLRSGVVPGRERDRRTRRRRFADEVTATHRRTNRWARPSGVPRVGWPLALGTTPWAVARELTATGGTSPPGTRHRVAVISPRRRDEAYDDILRAVDLGHAVPLFVGNGLLPRHVVLVVGGDSAHLAAYDPANGRVTRLPRSDFTRATLHVSGWTEPWFAVLPLV